MSKISKGEPIAQQLHAYFDDELAADQAKAVEEALAADPALKSELDALGVLRGTVPASLMAAADAVPEARFEQIWDEIDRAIERDARLQADADRRGSVWTRLWSAVSTVRVPLLAATAAAAVTVLVVGTGPDDQADDGPNNPPSVASVDEDPGTDPKAPQAGGAPQAEPTKVADANPGRPFDLSGSSAGDPEPTLPPMPVPENNEVEIHDIQFGAGSGSISSNGTVTVLYVEEDEEQHPSERSL